MRWLLCLVAVAAWGSPLDLTYTLSGVGGFSAPLLGISDGPFWWMDQAGLTSDTFGFSIVDPSVAANSGNDFPQGIYYPPALRPNSINLAGSTLLSSPFAISDAELLSISIITTPWDTPRVWDSIGFALLLRQDKPAALLYNARIDGLKEFGDPYFTKPTTGVTITSSVFNVIQSSTEPPINGRTAGEITSTYAPGRGVFQLLFGDFSFNRSLVQGPPAVMVVKSVDRVSMDDGDCWPTLLAGFAALGLAWRYMRRGASLPA